MKKIILIFFFIQLCIFSSNAQKNSSVRDRNYQDILKMRCSRFETFDLFFTKSVSERSDSSKITLIVYNNGEYFIYLVNDSVNKKKHFINPDILELNSNSTRLDTAIYVHYFLQKNITNRNIVEAYPIHLTKYYSPSLFRKESRYYFMVKHFNLFKEDFSCDLIVYKGVIIRLYHSKIYLLDVLSR